MKQNQNFFLKNFKLEQCGITYKRSQSIQTPKTSNKACSSDLQIRTGLSTCQDLLVQFEIKHGVTWKWVDEISLKHFQDFLVDDLDQQNINSTIQIDQGQTFLMNSFICKFNISTHRQQIQHPKKSNIQVSQYIMPKLNGMELKTIIQLGVEEIQILYQLQILQQKQLDLLPKMDDLQSDQFQKSINQQEQTPFFLNDLTSIDHEIAEDYSTELHSKTSSQQIKFHNKKIHKNPRKSDKKNVVKNFVKAFKSYLLTWGTVQDFQKILPQNISLATLRSQFVAFEGQQRYNNHLVKNLLNNPTFSNVFKFFLKNRAYKWLLGSGVVDKDSHNEVLRGWIKASEDERQMEKIVCLRSREK